ncbi:MAG: hypothetical protein GC162_02650 [Planctomycetes bacterium]|nr:hypothetical protein [Planctomycetota bacterium]
MSDMDKQGRSTRVSQWIHSDTCAVHVWVDAVIPDADPCEACFEPVVVKFLDHVQQLADVGDLDALRKLGDVYVRQSA